MQQFCYWRYRDQATSLTIWSTPKLSTGSRLGANFFPYLRMGLELFHRKSCTEILTRGCISQPLIAMFNKNFKGSDAFDRKVVIPWNKLICYLQDFIPVFAGLYIYYIHEKWTHVGKTVSAGILGFLLCTWTRYTSWEVYVCLRKNKIGILIIGMHIFATMGTEYF